MSIVSRIYVVAGTFALLAALNACSKSDSHGIESAESTGPDTFIVARGLTLASAVEHLVETAKQARTAENRLRQLGRSLPASAGKDAKKIENVLADALCQMREQCEVLNGYLREMNDKLSSPENVE